MRLARLRNDDVAADTSLHEIRTFCELCDKYGITPIHAITPIGCMRPILVSMDNATILKWTGRQLFEENTGVVSYLRERTADRFAVHGLWHTHDPNLREIEAGYTLLWHAGIDVEQIDYYVPPFNEVDPEDCGLAEGLDVLGLKLLANGLPRIEDYLESGDPQAEMMYTHSWRYEHGPFSWPALDKCLARLTGKR